MYIYVEQHTHTRTHTHTTHTPRTNTHTLHTYRTQYFEYCVRSIKHTDLPGLSNPYNEFSAYVKELGKYVAKYGKLEEEKVDGEDAVLYLTWSQFMRSRIDRLLADSKKKDASGGKRVRSRALDFTNSEVSEETERLG
jgi:hypothetical protein